MYGIAGDDDDKDDDNDDDDCDGDNGYGGDDDDDDDDDDDNDDDDDDGVVVVVVIIVGMMRGSNISRAVESKGATTFQKWAHAYRCEKGVKSDGGLARFARLVIFS
jgi:hypothetical protein